MALPLLAWMLGIALWDLSVDRARQRTIATLVRGDTEQVRQLRRRLEATPAPNLIRSLRHLGKDRSSKRLLAQTVQALARHDSEQVVPLLVGALAAEDEKLRLNAAMSLAFLGGVALPTVIETLHDAPEVRVRASAAWILSLMGNDDPRVIEALESARDDESKDVRYTARYSLHQLRTSNNALREAADRLRDLRQEQP